MLCKACYALKGNGPLIFSADEVFSRLEGILEIYSVPEKVENVSDEVVVLMAECEEPFIEKIII